MAMRVERFVDGLTNGDLRLRSRVPENDLRSLTTYGALFGRQRGNDDGPTIDGLIDHLLRAIVLRLGRSVSTHGALLSFVR